MANRNRPNQECRELGCAAVSDPTGRGCNDEICPQMHPKPEENLVKADEADSSVPASVSKYKPEAKCMCNFIGGKHQGCCPLGSGRSG
ncbi:MAG: hypothetical protein PHP25_03355 [Candidatus Moranbacteria bacterium]|nr:hypothetical protein [Candidatus Moranbacteria bacterium]